MRWVCYTHCSLDIVFDLQFDKEWDQKPKKISEKKEKGVSF